MYKIQVYKKLVYNKKKKQHNSMFKWNINIKIMTVRRKQ